MTKCVWMLLRINTHTHAYSAGRYTQMEASLWGPSLKRRLINSSWDNMIARRNKCHIHWTFSNWIRANSFSRRPLGESQKRHLRTGIAHGARGLAKRHANSRIVSSNPFKVFLSKLLTWSWMSKLSQTQVVVCCSVCRKGNRTCLLC